MAISTDPKLFHPRHCESGTARIAPVLAILFLIALGALAMPHSTHADQDRDQYRDQDRDRDRDRDHDRDRLLWVSRESFPRDFGGGNGGRPSPDALCDPGSVAVGFHVQTGEYFNQAWLECARIREDGRLGEETRMTGRTGSPGGRPVSDAFCPEHFALRGLRGRTGASIDEAAGICSPLHEIAERDDRPRTELTPPILRPHAGGHPAEAVCPPGAVVTGFTSKSGEWMDHLWIVCSELRRRDRDDYDRR
jgi:hypothetical protein